MLLRAPNAAVDLTGKVDFPGAKSPLDAALDGNRFQISGSLYSAEPGSTGALQLNGTVDGKRIKGTASWDKHTMTFEASKAD